MQTPTVAAEPSSSLEKNKERAQALYQLFGLSQTNLLSPAVRDALGSAAAGFDLDNLAEGLEAWENSNKMVRAVAEHKIRSALSEKNLERGLVKANQLLENDRQGIAQLIQNYDLKVYAQGLSDPVRYSSLGGSIPKEVSVRLPNPIMNDLTVRQPEPKVLEIQSGRYRFRIAGTLSQEKDVRDAVTQFLLGSDYAAIAGDIKLGVLLRPEREMLKRFQLLMQNTALKKDVMSYLQNIKNPKDLDLPETRKLLLRIAKELPVAPPDGELKIIDRSRH